MFFERPINTKEHFGGYVWGGQDARFIQAYLKGSNVFSLFHYCLLTELFFYDFQTKLFTKPQDNLKRWRLFEARIDRFSREI